MERSALHLSSRSLQRWAVQEFYLSAKGLCKILPTCANLTSSAASSILLPKTTLWLPQSRCCYVRRRDALQDFVDKLVFHLIAPRSVSVPSKRASKLQWKTVCSKGSGRGKKLVTCDPERTDTTVQADSKCRSPGDARVNAGAMSRRKQVNPQHLSLTHRETIQGEFNSLKTW